MAPVALIARARSAIERHAASIGKRDVAAIVDFSAPSCAPRLHVVDLISGMQRSMLVAHGRGSDPDHSGWVERFSNAVGSQASSAGAYLTGEIYMGKHGRSRRLIGLDPENNNARQRGIVIHSASYVSPSLALETGKLGRSEGCLAVGQEDIEDLLELIGPGHMIYVDKV